MDAAKLPDDALASTGVVNLLSGHPTARPFTRSTHVRAPHVRATHIRPPHVSHKAPAVHAAVKTPKVKAAAAPRVRATKIATPKQAPSRLPSAASSVKTMIQREAVHVGGNIVSRSITTGITLGERAFANKKAAEAKAAAAAQAAKAQAAPAASGTNAGSTPGADAGAPKQQ